MKNEIQDRLKEARNAFEDLHNALRSIPWGERGNSVGMWRNGEGIVNIGVSILDDSGNNFADVNSSMDEFLDTTEDIYSCGDSGRIIEDLEILKIKIQERINRFRAED